MGAVKLAGNPRIDVYRVGFGRDLHELRAALRFGDWWGVRCRVRWMLRGARRWSWWGVWQAEWDGCGRCPRGLTERRARRKALRRIYAERAMLAVPAPAVSQEGGERDAG